MSELFLAADIGNSQIKCALFEGTEIESTFSMATDSAASVAAYRHSLRSRLADRIPSAAGICSVVPEVTEMLLDAIRSEFMALPTVVGPTLEAPFEIDYQPAASLGADRLAAASAARLIYGHDEDDNPRAVIVVDAGTAVNYEVISAGGAYRGGAIAPGPGLSGAALEGGTSKLPRVSLEVPRKAIGQNTGDALRSGVMFGFLDGVEGMLARLTADLGEAPFIVATGGYGEMLVEHISAITAFHSTLVLEGVRLLVQGS